MSSRTRNQNQKRPNPGQRQYQTEEAQSRASSDLLRKLPPQNLEAEQSVLGGVFQSNTAFHSLVDILGAEDFYSPGHEIIFRAFVDLYNKSVPIDLVTVTEHLAASGELDAVGGPVYLAELSDSVVSAANTLHHARIIRDKSISRGLIDVAGEIISKAYDSMDVEELLDESEQSIYQIANARSKSTIFGSKEMVDKVFEDLQNRVGNEALITGIPTRYDKFDLMTSGLQNSDLIIIAGRPSMGKTAFAMNIAARVAIDPGVTTAVFSLEMSRDQLIMRMLATQGKVELSKLRSGYLDDNDWNKLYDAAEVLSNAQLFIDDTPALSTLELRARCRRLKSERNLGLIVVDYLQLMRSSSRTDSREQEISDISRNLKAIAKELNVPVIALSQLNRKVEERTDKRPMMSDLRESGAIEQDADVIIFIYRDEFYNKSEDNPKRGIAEIIIGKQRNGPTGEVELRFLKKCTAFEMLNEIPYPSEYPGAD